MNSATRKFKITIAVLCVGMLALVGTLVGVLAASSQSLKVGFDVNYSVGDEVAAKVKTQYIVPGSEEGLQTATQNSNGEVVTNAEGYVVYNAGDSNGSKSIDVGQFTLTPKTPSVEFYFTIHNMLQEGFVQVIFGKDYTAKNMTLKTYYANTDDLSLTAYSIDPTLWKTYNHVANAAPNGCKMIKVVVSVDNINASASIAGDFNLTLNYSETEENLAGMDSVKAYETLMAAAYQIGGVPDLVFDYACNNPDYSTTGQEIQVDGDESVWAYLNDQTFYVLSNSTISLPEDCTGLFSSGHSSLVLNNIDTSSVTNMQAMFENYSGASIDVSLFDTSSVTNMSYMFNLCRYLTIDLSGWDTSSVTDMSHMFFQCGNLTSIDVSGWDTSSVTDMSYMFYYCDNLTSIDLTHFDTSCVTDMSYMFYTCTNLTSIDLSDWDTSSVTDMSYMFYTCTNLTSIDLSDWDTSSVTDMSYMFTSCVNLTSIDLTGWDTSSVTNMYDMFSGCNNLTSIDLSHFDTSSVTNMSQMFDSCDNLSTIYVSDGWSTASVTSSNNMFSSCNKLKGAVAYDSAKTDKTMANVTTGYLTYKAN